MARPDCMRSGACNEWGERCMKTSEHRDGGAAARGGVSCDNTIIRLLLQLTVMVVVLTFLSKDMIPPGFAIET